MILAVTGLRREARIVESADVVAISGGGDRASLEKQLSRASQVRGIISFGVAGALAPDLKPGSCVIASHVIDGDETFACDDAWLKLKALRLPHARVAPIAGSYVVIPDSAAKAALYRKTGAAAVDMESHIAARVARERNVPFIAVRTISDGAERSLPPAAAAALKPDGRIDFVRLARSVVAQPTQIPALIRTARESEQAFAALLRCRSLLGPGLAFPDFGELMLDVA